MVVATPANTENHQIQGPIHLDERTTSDKHTKSQHKGTSESRDIAVSNSSSNGTSTESQDDDYNEDEDEDYVIDDSKNVNNNNKDSDSEDGAENDDEYIGDEDKKEIAKYSKIESSEGGLIKTRTQRQLENEREKAEKKNKAVINSSTTSNTDINSIWAELNGSTSSKSKPKTTSDIPLENNTQSSTPSDQKIEITRSYEFAGKTVVEKKIVDINSQEAKAHLNSTSIKQSNIETLPSSSSPQSSSLSSPSSSSKNPNLRRKRKRASLLDAVISNSSKTKLSTLEKSRLDWATYVDKNKINDELKYKNKNGYLERQDFLNRVDSRRDNLYKDAKSKAKD